METITINEINYVLADYILKNAPIYSKSCRSSKDLIRKKNIDENNYLYARIIDSQWKISDGKSAKIDKVLIRQDFIKTINELQGENTIDDNGIEQAPNIIELDNHEKFRDNEDNIIEIQTRGERKHDQIYFKVTDIANGFEMDNLQDIIIDKRKSYQENVDYKYFICLNPANSGKKTCKNINDKPIVKKELFLTYQGILRVLFVSRNNKTDKFIKWASETLFTVQMGSIEQKNKLVSNILGVNAKVIKEVFNTNTNTLPCIYLFTLGTVKTLRSSMTIDHKYYDDSIVCKYGFTKDLSRRTVEHIDTFKSIPNCDLKLKFYGYVDPQYTSKAEIDIKQIINAFNINFNYKNYEELVIIPTELMKIIHKQYDQISKSYMGHISELITKIKELEDKYEKQELKHQLELQQEKFNNELLKKELEIAKLKNTS